METENQTIVKYIQLSLSQGKSKEEIYKELLDQGVSIDVIQDAFNQIIIKKKKEGIKERIVRIIVTIGAILIGVGIFSFIAANWQEITRVTKVLIIVISMIISYSIGWFLKEKMHYKKTGEALILLGGIIYGAGIFLIAQMFHIRANWPDGFILWMVGNVVMAFAVESFALFYLALFTGFFAIIGYSEIFLFNFYLLTPYLPLLIATIVTFVTGWLIKNRMSP